jgi:hypothetical protein
MNWSEGTGASCLVNYALPNGDTKTAASYSVINVECKQ